MELHGVTGKPYKHPEVRRKIPGPFMRPAISTPGAEPVKRSWKDTSVLKVEQGDTVADFGIVAEVVEFVNIPSRESFSAPPPEPPTWRIRLHNVMGEYQDYPGEQRVYAFTKDKLSAPEE